MVFDSFNRTSISNEPLFIVGDVWIHQTKKARLEIVEIHESRLTVLGLKGPKKGERVLIPKSMLNGVSRTWWNEKNENKILFED